MCFTATLPAAHLHRFRVEGHEYTDNNGGKNYLVSANLAPAPHTLALVHRVKVALEEVVFDAARGTHNVNVIVSNVAYHKTVVVRASGDGWATHTDYPAFYVGTVADNVDKFTVRVPACMGANIVRKHAPAAWCHAHASRPRFTLRELGGAARTI